MTDRVSRRPLPSQLPRSHAFGQDLVVRTRFIPPRPRPQLIPRPRLDQLLSHLLDYPLTVLRAEAGYGKTTAIAGFLAGSGLPSFWYDLGESNADPLTFLIHLIHLFRGVYPGIGERALELLAREGGAARLWAPAVDALANDLLDSLSTETVLVLDDYCTLNRPETNAIAERLIEHMPPRLHLVITARSVPDLPSFARWRASGELLEIGRSALGFTPEEIVALFTRQTGRPLALETARALAVETEGWPIAVRMLSEGANAGGPAALDNLLGRIRGPSEVLFDYLAEEVFLRQPLDLQTFLAETAILRRLDPEACNSLLGRADSESVLRSLEERSLFVAREGTYRYHRLFRDFLLRRAEVPAGRRRALHAQAAAYYRSRSDHEEAIYHLLAAREYPAAAALLATIGPAMVDSGRHQTLAAWLDRLPDDLLDAYPDLLLARGHGYRFASRYSEALVAYGRAGRRFESLADPIGEVHALRGQALVYLDTVQPARADPLLRRALRKLGRGDRNERAALLILLAENKINAGRLLQAERLQRAIYRVVTPGDPPPVDPRVYVRDGRFAVARQIVETQLRADPWGVGQWRAPRSHREAVVLLAWIDAMTGEGESARRYAGQSLELGRALGAPIVECVSLSRLGHGWLSGKDYDLERARACYEESRAIAERIGVPRFKVESLLGLTITAGLEGRFAEASANAREALSILEETGDRYMTAVLFLALGAAASLCDHPQAEHWLEEAALLGAACGDRFGPCVATLWRAIARSRAGRAGEALVLLSRVLDRAQTDGYDFLFTRVPLLGPKDRRSRRELLSLLRLIERDRGAPQGGYAARLLSEWESPPALGRAAPLRQETRATAPLFIRTLGPFRVWRNGREIEPAAWRREKAVHLLQYLVCQRGRAVHREQILEALWPGTPLSAAAVGLRVALSALRKALTPPGSATKGRHTATDLIRREGESLRLALEAGVQVDVDEFARLLRSARTVEATAPGQAVEQYESALALYQGDFLEENPYAEWAGGERERQLVEYLSAADRLATILLDREEYDRSARWANAILMKDPLWEQAYVLLMRCHARQGNRALAVRTYERCRKRLHQALGVEPSPGTTALFEAILRG